MKISIKFEGHGHGQALTSEGWLVRSDTPSSNGQSNPIARCCAFHNLKHEILSDGRALCRNLLHLCQLWLDQSNFWKPTNSAVVKFRQHSFAVEKYNLLSWRNTFCSVGEIHFAPSEKYILLLCNLSGVEIKVEMFDKTFINIYKYLSVHHQGVCLNNGRWNHDISVFNYGRREKLFDGRPYSFWHSLSSSQGIEWIKQLQLGSMAIIVDLSEVAFFYTQVNYLLHFYLLLYLNLYCILQSILYLYKYKFVLCVKKYLVRGQALEFWCNRVGT